MPLFVVGENQYSITPEVFNQYVNSKNRRETSNCFYYKKHKKKVVFPSSIKTEMIIDKLQNYKQNTFYKICSIKDPYFDYYKKLKPTAPREFATKEQHDVQYYKKEQTYKAHSYDDNGKKTISFE